MSIRDWISEHFGVFGQMSRSLDEIHAALNAAGSVRPVDVVALQQAFEQVARSADTCRFVVDGAAALPTIPDRAAAIQFGAAMDMWRNSMAAMRVAADQLDRAELDKAIAYSAEGVRKTADVHAELRRAWPDDEPWPGDDRE